MLQADDAVAFRAEAGGSTAVEVFDEAVEAVVDFLHGFEGGVVRAVVVGVQAFVGVAVGGGVTAVCGVAVLVGKPVPADAGAAFQQFDDEVLVEVAAVFLGFDDPAFTAFVGKSRVFAFAVKLADEEGVARPVLPLLHLPRFRLPFVVVVDGECPCICRRYG